MEPVGEGIPESVVEEEKGVEERKPEGQVEVAGEERRGREL